MAKPSDLTPVQRAEIVLSLLRKEEPASILARRHGISANTLGQWRDEFIAGGTANLASGKCQKREEAQQLLALQAAVEERDRVIGEITIANRILKKRVGTSSSTTTPGRR